MEKVFTVHAMVNGWTRPTGIVAASIEEAEAATETSPMCEGAEGWWPLELSIDEDGQPLDISDPIH